MDAKMQNYIEKVGRSVNTENDVTGLQTAMTHGYMTVELLLLPVPP